MKELEGFHNYRSAFDTQEPDVTTNFSDETYDHMKWCRYRDNYAEHGGRIAYNLMLSTVTLDNPPLAPRPDNHRQWKREDTIWMMVLWFFAIVFLLTIAGVI